MTYYDATNMKFPSLVKQHPEEESRTLSTEELTVLAELLNGIKNGNYFETMMKITYKDKKDVNGLIDKINWIAQNNA